MTLIYRIVLPLLGLSTCAREVSAFHFCRRTVHPSGKFSCQAWTKTEHPSWIAHETNGLSLRTQQNLLERYSLSRNGHTSLFISNSDSQEQEPRADGINWSSFVLFSGVGFLYWYLMVFGAAAQANGLPVPDFIPMTPGWPATDADFAPVLEDSYHFFYLSELLHNDEAPYVIPPRLAIFNIVEAWIFAMLPALWADTRRRLPRPILLLSWLVLGINLTNAFLAPYLAITELRSASSDGSNDEQQESYGSSLPSLVVSRLFGAIATTVVGFALYQSVAVASAADWSEFLKLVQTDRSYLAFCIDPLLFALFQPFILQRVKNDLQPVDYVPFVGLLNWLFTVGTVSTKE